MSKTNPVIIHDVVSIEKISAIKEKNSCQNRTEKFIIDAILWQVSPKFEVSVPSSYPKDKNAMKHHVAKVKTKINNR